MSHTVELEEYLDRWSAGDDLRAAVAVTLIRLAESCRQISNLIARGNLGDDLGAHSGRTSGTDPQREIDVRSNDLIVAGLKGAPVASLASEELESALPINTGEPLAVAVDPIDGSSNIDANVTIGTIFTILPARANGADASSFLQAGAMQLAAGFALYGPYTAFVLTVGQGTVVFTLDRGSGRFSTTGRPAAIPLATSEYAINQSNYRHWHESIRTYVDDCVRGRTGPRNQDFNMRWTASPVADVFRILARGGIFLYPTDQRQGYEFGRLRLVYEANPLAWIIEQAGGAACNGTQRILDIRPKSLHQRVGFIAGSRTEVDYVMRLHQEPHGLGERNPLFGRRGLFRF